MERKNYYDIAKFIAILSVIIYHVENYLIDNQIIYSFINTYFLSLFFIISGLLLKSEKSLQKGWLKRQAVRLMLPFFTCFIAYNLFIGALYREHFFNANDFADTKSGYWFLLTLFEFLCVYRCLIGLISRTSNLLIKILILFSPFVVVNLLCVFLPADISCWLSLMSFRRYYLFFAAGYALSNIFKGDNIENNKVWIVSSILYILGTLYYVQYVKSVDGIIDLVIWILTNFVGCHFWLCLCRRFEKNFSNPIVLNIGKTTMGIYTLHYFPLRCLQYLHDNGFINGVNLASTCYFCLSVLVIISLAYCMTILAGCNKYSSIVFLGKV